MMAMLAKGSGTRSYYCARNCDVYGRSVGRPVNSATLSNTLARVVASSLSSSASESWFTTRLAMLAPEGNGNGHPVKP